MLLVSDDPLVRSGIASLLPEDQPVVRGVSASSDVPLVAAQCGASVVVWDTGDDGALSPVALPVLALVKDEACARRAVAGGARGVLLRDLQPERLAAAVLAVRCGLQVADERLAAAWATVAAPPVDADEAVESLTAREVEVLSLLAEGRSNREIGTALDISPHTAKFHVDRILAKLTASSRTDAVVRAVRLGLLTL